MAFAFIFLCNSLFSQNETQKWYFGDYAGLDFSTSPPTVLTNGALHSLEGCASISDAAGNLLFYTNGATVYDKTHAIMANGSGLMGDLSTTQSAIIVKQPGNSNIYFVFTQAAFAGPNGLRYSIVDMNLAGGMGAVTLLNVPLHAPSCEKLAAVKHCNGIDTWVVTHDWGSNNFRAYLVTASGVSTTPVNSAVGTVITNGWFIGQMKISPDGRKLGLAVSNFVLPAPFELYDFDPSTGIVSNPLFLGNCDPYGCEFSPDGTKFYGTQSHDQIFQWDLCAGSNADIAASQYTIAISNTLTMIGSMQLASDGKIYIALVYSGLGIINNPNMAGAACNYTSAGLAFTSGTVTYGLPNFISSFFKPVQPSPPAPFNFSITCSSVTFSIPTIPSGTLSGCNASNNPVTSVSWLFGDPASGSANTSTLNYPTHIYNSPGTYTVKLTLMNACSTETISIPVTIQHASPNLNVAGNFSICTGEKRTYTVSGASTYTWSNNATTQTISITPTGTGTYSVSGTGTNTCKSSKIFTVNVSKCTGINLLNDDDLLKIYPNPANNHLFIETGSDIKIMLLDQLGTVVFERSFESGIHTMDLSKISSGIYTLKSTDGKLMRTTRLVKME